MSRIDNIIRNFSLEDPKNFRFYGERNYLNTKVTIITSPKNEYLAVFNEYGLIFKCDEITFSKKKNLISFPRLNILPKYLFDDFNYTWSSDMTMYTIQNISEQLRQNYNDDFDITICDTWRDYCIFNTVNISNGVVKKGLLFDYKNKRIYDQGNIIPESVCMSKIAPANEGENFIDINIHERNYSMHFDLDQCKFYKMIQGVIMSIVRLDGINVFYTNNKFFPIRSYIDIKDPSFLVLMFSGNKILPERIFGDEKFNNICYKFMLSHPILSGVSKINIPKNGFLSLISSTAMWNRDNCPFSDEITSTMDIPLNLTHLDPLIRESNLSSLEEANTYLNYGDSNPDIKHQQLFEKFPFMANKLLPGEAVLICQNEFSLEVSSFSFNYRKNISFGSNDKYIGYIKYLDKFFCKRKKVPFLIDNLIIFSDLDIKKLSFNIDYNFYNNLIIDDFEKGGVSFPESFKNDFFKNIEKQIALNYLYSLSNYHAQRNNSIMYNFNHEINHIYSERHKMKKINTTLFQGTKAQKELLINSIPSFILFLDNFESQQKKDIFSFVSALKSKFSPMKIHLFHQCYTSNNNVDVVKYKTNNITQINDTNDRQLILDFSSGEPKLNY